MTATADRVAVQMLARLLTEGEPPRPAILRQQTDRAAYLVRFLRQTNAIPANPADAARVVQFIVNPANVRTPGYARLMQTANQYAAALTV